MSITGSVIMVVSDHKRFSGWVTELLLRAGVRAIRFAKSTEASAQIQEYPPDLVILHVPQDQHGPAWQAYQTLQRDLQQIRAPVLLYGPDAAEPGQAGADREGQSIDICNRIVARLEAIATQPPAEDQSTLKRFY